MAAKIGIAKVVSVVEKVAEPVTGDVVKQIKPPMPEEDIRMLYEARDDNQQVRVGNKHRRELLSLTTLSDLWDELYGGPVDEALLGDVISALANAESGMYLNSRIKEVITRLKVHGHSLEQTLEFLETKHPFTSENYEAAEYFSEHREI